MNLELFSTWGSENTELLGRSAYVLRGRALAQAQPILAALQRVKAQSPLRTMKTPGGHAMSVSTTSCGKYGWISDPKGYRYSDVDPLTQKPWPIMPKVFVELAQEVAAEVGFGSFEPDSCLINRYEPRARMSLHQDRDEQDLSAPIVSISLGLPAVFLFGGLERNDKTLRVPLFHGDVVVWGGEDRMRFHGVLPLKDGEHPELGAQRINLTFRRTK